MFAYPDMWCFQPAHCHRCLGNSSLCPGSQLQGCTCGWALRRHKKGFWISTGSAWPQEALFISYWTTAPPLVNKDEYKRESFAGIFQMVSPFLAPVLYCCHSASASAVVPKNSPTHSSSCRKTHIKITTAPRQLKTTQLSTLIPTVLS